MVWEYEDTYKDYVMGKFDPHNMGWADVDFVYSSVNTGEHWVVVALDMNRGRVFMFDSLPSITSKKKLDYVELVQV